MSCCIVTFNAFLPVNKLIKQYDQFTRASKIKQYVLALENHLGRSIDVIVFQELIPNCFNAIVDKDLKSIGFVHHTTDMFKGMLMNSGIRVFSKHVITQTDFMTFGDICSGSDCFASKGVLYTRILFNDQVINLFGTHLQATDCNSSVREKQLTLMFDYISKFDIDDSEELTLIAGDFNINKYGEEYKTFTKMAGKWYQIVEPNKRFCKYTRIVKNPLVGLDNPYEYKNSTYPRGCVQKYLKDFKCSCCANEWLDYVLLKKSTKHLIIGNFLNVKSLDVQLPTYRMQMTKNRYHDVNFISDHFPVAFEFTVRERLNLSRYPRLIVQKNTNRRRMARESTNDLMKRHAVLTQAFIVLVLVFSSLAFLFIAWIVWLKLRQIRRLRR